MGYVNGRKLNSILSDEIEGGNDSFEIGKGSTNLEERSRISLSKEDSGNIIIKYCPQTIGQIVYTLSEAGSINVAGDEIFTGGDELNDINEHVKPKVELGDILGATGIDISYALLMK